MDLKRLEQVGWRSFRPELFLGEPGRKARNVGPQFVSIVRQLGAQSVLELCCGGGKLCLELAVAGFDTTGIDLDDRMLAFAQAAAASLPRSVQRRVRFQQADMCTFDLGQRFDVVILEDDGFVYLLDLQDQLACLQRVVAHLADDGRFLLNFNTPQRELYEDHEREFTYDPQTQIKTCHCVWTSLEGDGTPTTVSEGFERRRLTYPCELELLLRVAGLTVMERWGDMKGTPFTNPALQEYHYLCRRT